MSKSLLYCSTQVVAPTVPHSRETRERGQRAAAGGMARDAGRVPSAVCRITGTHSLTCNRTMRFKLVESGYVISN